MKVALLCGGPSSEHEVSLSSSQAILENIDPSHDVGVFYISRDMQAVWFKPDGHIKAPADTSQYLPLLEAIKKYLTGVDVAFLAGIHGEFVEDGRLQTILDFFHVKYTGSGPDASALAMDKYRSSILVGSQVQVTLPATHLVDLTKTVSNPFSSYPVVMKPNNLGSSVGVHIVDSPDELQAAVTELREIHRARQALIQECVQGAIEVSCGVLEDKDGKFTLLPPVEIIPQAAEFFDYDAKYAEGGSIEISPPRSVPQPVSDRVSRAARDIHLLLGCRTYSRSDFFVKGENIIYLETNTLPGMTKTSLLPRETQAIGMSYRQLLEFLLTNSVSDDYTGE